MPYITFIVLTLVFSSINANPNGPPAGYANSSPNFRNCTSCHIGNVNSGNGQVEFEGLPLSYVPGQTYTISLVVTGSNSRGYGFQATSNSGNQSAGQFLISQNSSQVELNGNYVQQSSRTQNGNWIFDWLAPDASAGEVVFSASGLATGGSSGYNGDQVYITSVPISPQNVSIENNPTPDLYRLYQNYPNPFNPITNIQFELPKNEKVEITIYDILGSRIKTLLNQKQTIGIQSIQWDATNDLGVKQSGGIYFLIFKAGNFRQTKKMILLD